MKKPIAHCSLVLVCVICSCFSCRVEEIPPAEVPFTLLGEWKIETISTNQTGAIELITELEFEEGNLFSIQIGRDSIVQGNYVLSQTDDLKPVDFLTLFGGKHFRRSFLIEEKKSIRLGLVPTTEVESGNIYYYTRK